MRRSLLFGFMLCLLMGCGVSVPKPEPTVDKTPPPPPEKEIYDKVAPMPHEAPPHVKTPGGDPK